MKLPACAALVLVMASQGTTDAVRWKSCSILDECPDVAGLTTFCAYGCFDNGDCERSSKVCQPCAECKMSTDGYGGKCKDHCGDLATSQEYEYEGYGECFAPRWS